MLETITNTLGCQIHEQEICSGIDNFGRILRHDIVLSTCQRTTARCQSRALLTSSHQSSVEVTGDQKPSCSGGYGMAGSCSKKVAMMRRKQNTPKAVQFQKTNSRWCQRTGGEILQLVPDVADTRVERVGQGWFVMVVR